MCVLDFCSIELFYIISGPNHNTYLLDTTYLTLPIIPETRPMVGVGVESQLVMGRRGLLQAIFMTQNAATAKFKKLNSSQLLHAKVI